MIDGGLESQNFPPGGLQKGLLPELLPMPTSPELRHCWTTPKELSFPVERQIRRQDTLPLQSLVELGRMIRSWLSKINCPECIWPF